MAYLTPESREIVEFVQHLCEIHFKVADDGIELDHDFDDVFVLADHLMEWFVVGRQDWDFVIFVILWILHFLEEQKLIVIPMW